MDFSMTVLALTKVIREFVSTSTERPMLFNGNLIPKASRSVAN